MSSADHDHGYPRLPVELIEAIFSLLWSSPLSTKHRICLMTTSMLVNKAWRTMFFQMSLKHVYIPNSSYLDTYLATLSGISPFLVKKARSLPSLLCRSISVTVDYTPIGGLDDPTPIMEKVLSNLLYFLRILDTTPQLHTLCIDYIHGSCNDFFDFLSYNPLPETLNRLELKCTFPKQTLSPKSDVDTLRHPRRLAPVAFILPNIRHLTILGGTEALIASLVLMCPELETLQLDKRSWLDSGEYILAKKLGSQSGGKGIEKVLLSIARKGRSTMSEAWIGSQTSFENGVGTFYRD